MKVENREFKEKQIGNRYINVFLQALKKSPTKGLNIGEMRELSGTIDVLEAHRKDKTFELTKDQIKQILEKTREIQWVVYNKELIEMDDYLNSL